MVPSIKYLMITRFKALVFSRVLPVEFLNYANVFLWGMILIFYPDTFEEEYYHALAMSDISQMMDEIYVGLVLIILSLAGFFSSFFMIFNLRRFCCFASLIFWAFLTWKFSFSLGRPSLFSTLTIIHFLACSWMFIILRVRHKIKMELDG